MEVKQTIKVWDLYFTPNYPILPINDSYWKRKQDQVWCLISHQILHNERDGENFNKSVLQQTIIWCKSMSTFGTECSDQKKAVTNIIKNFTKWKKTLEMWKSFKELHKITGIATPKI